MPNTMKTELVEALQEKRGCFWMGSNLVQCSRKLSKSVCLSDGFVELPAAVFDEESPDLASVPDDELREWLSFL